MCHVCLGLFTWEHIDDWEKPPVARKLSEDGPFELRFERNYDLTPVILCGED